MIVIPVGMPVFEEIGTHYVGNKDVPCSAEAVAPLSVQASNPLSPNVWLVSVCPFWRPLVAKVATDSEKTQ